jgi:hypothetical protein
MGNSCLAEVDLGYGENPISFYGWSDLQIPIDRVILLLSQPKSHLGPKGRSFSFIDQLAVVSLCSYRDYLKVRNS